MRIAARFNGPAGSANGGVTAGRLAAYVGAAAVEVTLRRPPGPVRLLIEPRILDRGPMFRFGGPAWESAL